MSDKECQHIDDYDWTRYFKTELVQHLFCPRCGRHVLRGVYFNKDEWEDYINEGG